MTTEETDEKIKQLEQQLATEETTPKAQQKASPSKQSAASRTSESKHRSSVVTSGSSAGNKVFHWITFSFTLLVASALAAISWFGYQQFNQITLQVTETKLTLEQTLKQTQQREQALASQVQQLQDDAVSQSALQNQNIQTVLEQLTSTEERLLQVSGRRSHDWILAEADYLVQMAGRKLWLEKDVDTAIAMLQVADQRLTDLKDASLLPVRQKIANDINALQGLERVSQPQLVLQLQSLIATINNLPMKAVQLPDPVDMEIQNSVSENIDDWRTNLTIIWRGLVEDFITIRRRSSDTEALMAPQQQWYIQENLKHQLLQAQLALLREQQALFNQAVMQTSKWLSEYYDTSDSQVKQTLGTLNKLLKQSIQPEYPTSLTAISALKDVMEQRLVKLYQAGAETQ